ncbi:MAG TPA: 50S ribosomal protein L17 [Verrucomicrobia bacterium]|nr:MAG: 50S ribosomal protein L17 [Lentisphaerae bacterium GWF2_57_35]HBA83578.1 50S ribosomal protein L17 [Verrucomicrobiota bacterium]
MRHRKKTIKLGRPTAQREALLSGLVCSLIASKRIVTTLQKAKAVRTMAEKMVTLGKAGTPSSRSLALSRLRNKDSVAELFASIAPAFKDRAGGYTRIMRMSRRSDSAEMAVLEWVNYIPKPPKKKVEKKPTDAKAAPEASASEAPEKGKAKEAKAAKK